MHPLLAITRNRHVPLNLRRLLGEWFLRMDGRDFELDIGSAYRGRLDNYVEWMVYLTGQYFEFPYINLVRRMHRGGIALDVGANLGNHALAYAEIFDEVYSIEPYPPVFDRLVARREVSRKIHPFRFALSDRKGSASFKAPGTDNLGIGCIAEDGDFQVETVIGDDFARSEIGRKIDFIKIDVEGHEQEVIRGLVETLRRDRPTVIFEASKAVLKSADSMRRCFELFPEDYVFHRLSGQSSWPIQRDVAKTYPIGRDSPKPRRRSCDVVCFGREADRLQGL